MDLQEETISLVIKTPNQAHEDQPVHGVSLHWTVKDLKTHLSTVFPTKPLVSDQRLIYSGKLLPDHLHIRDLFGQVDSIPTLHLVCTLRNPPTSLGARPKTNLSPTSAAAPAGPSSPSPAQAPNTSELRQRRQTTVPAADTTQTQTPAAPVGPDAAPPAAPEMTQPAFPNYSLYSPQQLLWLQHVYARQYYMQYHAAWAAAGSVPSASTTTIGPYPPVSAHQAPVPAPLANQNPINNLPANQNPAQDAAFINPAGANQNIRINAQGGPVMEDEEDMDRDWLDWMYSAARFGVLLTIVYFNSSLSRFVMVMSTLLLMYLHRAGWFPFRRVQVQEQNPLQPLEAQHNQQNENRDPNPNLPEEPEGGEAEEVAGAAAEEGPDHPGPTTAVLVPPHSVSVMWTLWVFVKTFFSSLIPEAPQGIAN